MFQHVEHHDQIVRFLGAKISVDLHNPDLFAPPRIVHPPRIGFDPLDRAESAEEIKKEPVAATDIKDSLDSIIPSSSFDLTP